MEPTLRTRFSTLAVVGLTLFCLHFLAPSVRAQFYAPDTEFHDRVQRHFVVELARVLAWRQNQSAAGPAGQPHIAEVTAEVSVSGDRQNTWKIRWLDAGGAPLRETVVRYPESALVNGPAWYRDVAKQLAFPPGTPTPATDPEAEAGLVRDYWAGAESAEPSRAASLSAAFALGPKRTPPGWLAC